MTPTTNGDGRNTRLILASKSPRRASLMREYGYDVRIVESPNEEPDASAIGKSPGETAEAISLFKAERVATLVGNGVILAGDTVVARDGLFFGKPVDRADAHRILSSISGTTHEVITGVTLLDVTTNRRTIRHDVTAVTMRPLRGRELETYLDTGAWRGKAGAYGIQDKADAFIERYEGSFTNVVGFPMELIVDMLTEWNIAPTRDGRQTSSDS